jgi:hypothetical protein
VQDLRNPVQAGGAWSLWPPAWLAPSPPPPAEPWDRDAAFRLLDETDRAVEALLPPGPARRHPELLAAVARCPDLESHDLAGLRAGCAEVVRVATCLAAL